MQAIAKSCREKYTVLFVKSATFFEPVHLKSDNKKLHYVTQGVSEQHGNDD
jgi:hypothetical protein